MGQAAPWMGLGSLSIEVAVAAILVERVDGESGKGHTLLRTFINVYLYFLTACTYT